LLIDGIPRRTPRRCSSASGDQRAQSRPAGAGCDIASVERQPTDPAFGPPPRYWSVASRIDETITSAFSNDFDAWTSSG
jgi:hypothetical protein